MTSTYEVEHEYGTSTIEGVHAFWFPAGHLVFLNEEGNAFAGFAAGTWHSFKKVEVEGTRLTIRPVAGEVKGTNYAIPAQDATDVLTREQVFALPVGTRVKSTDDLAEFEVVQGGASYVVYAGGDPRPKVYQHYADLGFMVDYTEFKVIA